MSISYPKNRIGVVCLGDVSETSLQLFKKEGYSLLTKEEIAESSIVYAHKANDLPKDILLLAPKMKAIGVLDGIKDNTLLDNLCQNGIVLFDDAKKNPRNETFIPKRIIDYINKGDSNLSSNFPNIMLHKVQNAHRLIHIHQNVPGIMAKLNNVLAQYGLNIEAQYLKTNKHIGYVITDVNQEYDKAVLNKLKKIDNTIKFRVLY